MQVSYNYKLQARLAGGVAQATLHVTNPNTNELFATYSINIATTNIIGERLTLADMYSITNNKKFRKCIECIVHITHCTHMNPFNFNQNPFI